MKKKLTVLALAFAMVLTMSASVFAVGQNNKEGHPSSAPGDAKIVKYLQAPEGVTLDGNKEFTFNFTPHAPSNDIYGVPVKTTGEGAWVATSTTIKISEMSNASAAADADTQNKVGTKTITQIFTGYNFPRAGEYTFKVKEAGTDGNNWTYAKDEYLLRLIVDNEGNIDDVTVQEVTTTTDPDTGDETETLGAKVNPEDVTPGDNITPDNPDTPDVDETVEPSPADSNGGFTFTNLYKPTVNKHDEPTTRPDDPEGYDPKNPDPDPTDPTDPGDIRKDPVANVDDAFVLEKYVLGEYGDQTADWTFKVKVTLPKNYKDFTLPSGWTDGEVKDVTLKHNGNFKFTELPVGTRIEVKEVGPVNGYTQLLTTSKTTDVPAGLSDASATTGGTVLVTEKGGYAICRNSFNDESITPTGIIINNLPYILLIGIALGGIVLFSRKRRYE